LSAAAGIIAGNLTYFVLSAAGIVALLFASYEVFNVVKWCGAAYLAFLGVRSLFARQAPALDAVAAEPLVRTGRALSAGFVTQIANPKAIVFFAAIVPQFLNPHAALGPQLGVLALVSQAIEFVVLLSYALAAGRVRRSAVVGRASLWIERFGGAVLLWIASWIAREPLAPAP
jgi:threonine/homoserine/homoserine lactone efflux protein